MEKLALHGGSKTRQKPFPNYPIITEDEKKAVLDVLDSGRLSTFVAAPGKNFLGGEKIRAFEDAFARKFSVQYAVAMNSATAALHAAVCGVGVGPGEEVIVPPYTFTSTATCALMHNAVPVFGDISPDTFCLDAACLPSLISPLTKAIIPVHLFGGPADMDEILKIARSRNLKVIEDCAQSPGGTYKGKLLGTLGDCGVFSFQETKNMMTGEGGMLITNDAHIADVAQKIRNHGEMVASGQEKRSYSSDFLGWNYRMTELEAALGIAQLQKLDEYNDTRIQLSTHLEKELQRFGCFTPTKPTPGSKHVYYVVPFKFDEAKAGISRQRFVEALLAEGIPCGAGYVRPLYLTPLYQHRRHFIYQHYKGNVSYEKGICPVAESLNDDTYLGFGMCVYDLSAGDIDLVADAFRKV